MKLFLIFFVMILCSCSPRRPEQIGTTYLTTEIECVKTTTELIPTMNMNGDFGMGLSSTCLVALCYENTVQRGKYPWHDRVIFKKKLDIQLCL